LIYPLIAPFPNFSLISKQHRSKEQAWSMLCHFFHDERIAGKKINIIGPVLPRLL
jgi:hypothetical protein